MGDHTASTTHPYRQHQNWNQNRSQNQRQNCHQDLSQNLSPGLSPIPIRHHGLHCRVFSASGHPLSHERTMTSFWHCALRSQAIRLPSQARRCAARQPGGLPDRTRPAGRPSTLGTAKGVGGHLLFFDLSTLTARVSSVSAVAKLSIWGRVVCGEGETLAVGLGCGEVGRG
jgi:hypothetical protein